MVSDAHNNIITLVSLISFLLCNQFIPCSNQETHVNNDHTSIRKLLMKLGEKFSDDDNDGVTHPQYDPPMYNSYLMHPICYSSINLMGSSPMKVINMTNQYNMNGKTFYQADTQTDTKRQKLELRMGSDTSVVLAINDECNFEHVM